MRTRHSKTGCLLTILLILTQFILVNAVLARQDENLKVKLLAINDFHGQLSPKTVAGRPAGGAAVLTAYLKNAQAGMEDRTIIISAGDFVGASPADSALLQDEPSIMFMNTLANAHCTEKMGHFMIPYKGLTHYPHGFHHHFLDPRCNIVATVGNHEFDEGVKELKRLIYGGNHPNGPFLENPYTGAYFPFVVANVIDNATGRTLLPPYVIKTIHNTPIAFIGAVLKDTPTIVAPAGVAGLTFLDEATAINSYIPEIKAKGVHAIVAVIHQGGSQSGSTITGDIVPIVKALDGEIDVVISGHTHTNLNGTLKNAADKDVLVTQAYSAGTAYAEINLEIDPRHKDIVKKSATIVTTYGDTGIGKTPDAAVAAIVAKADAEVAPLVNIVVGQAAGPITATQNAAGESALGNLIADAQRAYEGTQFAFMNPGGIRANIDKAGDVTWGMLFTIQPFGNQMVRMALTGQQIYDLLAQQWSTSSPKMLQISGLTYSWALDSVTNKGIIIEVRSNGALLDKGATYTVTTNNFLSVGGDGFTVFKSGLNQVVDAADIDVLVSYIKSLPQPFHAMIEGRIIRLQPTALPAGAAKFAVFSDPHLYDPTLGTTTPEFQLYVSQDRKMIAESSEILTPVLADLKARDLDFVLIPGDLTKDGELVDHQMMAAKLGELKSAGKKIFVVPGNHDINNPQALSYLSSPPTPIANVTTAKFAEIYANFGYGDALFRDPNSLSYITEPVPGVWLFAIDSCLYANNLTQGYSTTAGALSAATRSWLLDHLAGARALGKKIIGMMHHGILEHYTGQSIQFPEYVVQDWQNLSQIFNDNGLKIVFTGHFHANDVTQKTFGTSALFDVETGSLVTYPSPYRIVNFDITGKSLAIQTFHVNSTASYANFQWYAWDFLNAGMTGIVKYQLSHAPYNLTDPTLSYVTGLVVPAFIAHYAGDETPDAATISAYMSMMGSSDPVTKSLGQSLYSLWTDLPPADNNLTIVLQ